MTPAAIGEPVPANSVGIVVASQDPGVPVGTQVATYTGWQSYATTTVAPTEIADPALGGPVEWISVLSTTGVTAAVLSESRTGNENESGDNGERHAESKKGCSAHK